VTVVLPPGMIDRLETVRTHQGTSRSEQIRAALRAVPELFSLRDALDDDNREVARHNTEVEHLLDDTKDAA
jgi:Arc/MetJ-type ribon-helix-helix transcriptional regulator